jgi:PAS domain-containing protein
MSDKHPPMSARSAAAVAELPEMNPGPVFRLSLEGQIQLVNRAARELFHGDVLGRSWLDLCPGLEAGAWRQVLVGTGVVRCEVVLQGRTFLADRPYCDAMFIDNECRGLPQNIPKKHALGYSTRVFSLKTGERFIEYLRKLEENSDSAVLSSVREVYGPDWPRPFLRMYDVDRELDTRRQSREESR